VFKSSSKCYIKSLIGILNLRGGIGGGIVRKSFVMERCKSFASHKIDGATFGDGCFTARGSRNLLFDDVIASPRWPIPVRAQGLRQVHALLDVHGIPRLVSPDQNRTVRKGKSLNIKIRNGQTQFNHEYKPRDFTFVSRSTTFFRACSRPLRAQKLRRMILII
jgi:hypothetical protein